MTESQFTETNRPIAAGADCTPQYVTRLAREGLIPSVRASNGIYLFQPEAVALVAAIKAQRMALRGRKRAA